MPLTVHPLTPARWPDLEAIFNAKGCSIARGCWCMYCRESGKTPVGWVTLGPRELLQGAVAWAAKRGVKRLEAHPVDKTQRSHDEFLWHGAKSMFDAAGFEEVARRKPQRPVLRLRPA